MKNKLIAAMLLASAISMVLPDAQARRVGDGGSAGRQSSNASRQVTSPNQVARPATLAAAPAAAGAIAPKSGIPWKGIVGGALAGLGIAALLAHFGIGGAIGSVVGSLLVAALLAMAVMFIYRLLRSRNGGKRSALAGAYGSGNGPSLGSRRERSEFQHSVPADLDAQPLAAASAAPWGMPADFDTHSFLRNAKTYFIRLQAAWDKADIHDLREFTSPEMYAELRLQLQERGATENHTDVVSLNGELLGVEIVSHGYLARVKFSGTMKESLNAPAESFAEVWNMSKPKSGATGWVLAGIQQIS